MSFEVMILLQRIIVSYLKPFISVQTNGWLLDFCMDKYVV